MITITALSPDNAEEVYQVEKACFSTPWSLESFRKDLENKNAVYVCLEEDGKVIGYVGMWNISGEGNINNVAVLPDYRRKGYGRLLLSHLISYAKEHQLLLLTLEVRASNEGAIHLYESCGFEVVGRRKKYYDNCEDAILMTLPF